MRVKQNSKANQLQEVKQMLNTKVTEGGNMLKTKGNSASKHGSGGWTRTSDLAVNPSWEGPALPLSFY